MERELESLELERLNNDLLGVGIRRQKLPEVPTAEPSASKNGKRKGNHFNFVSKIYSRSYKNILFVILFQEK